MIGVKVLCSIFLNIWKIPPGSVSLLWRKMPTRSAPSRIMTTAAMSPSIPVKRGLILIVCPSAPRSHPSIPKPSILAVWKRIIFFLSLMVSWEAFADSERTSPPTTAKQLDTEATRPMIKLVTGVTCPPIPKLRIPDFWSIKNTPKNIKPTGIACQRIPSFSDVFFSSERVYPCEESFSAISGNIFHASTSSGISIVTIFSFITTCVFDPCMISSTTSSTSILQALQCMPWMW